MTVWFKGRSKEYGWGIMINDVVGDVRQRVLQLFRERQIYLRSGGEVKYYVFSTKLQLIIAATLSFMSLWCLFTLINLFWGNNPLRAPAKEVKLIQAKYERMLADEQAKQLTTELLLSEQKQSFETMAKSFEEKHMAIAQLMHTTSPVSPVSLPVVKYASNRVLMSPTLRDPVSRVPRKSISSDVVAETGLDIDQPLNAIDQTQNKILITAEAETLDRIERNRALIRATDMQVDTVLKEGSFGKGGLYIPLNKEDLPIEDGKFGSRVASIQARLSEAEALDKAVHSLPLGFPVDGDTYKTSSYGVRHDPFTRRPTFHEGIDFGGHSLEPIVATADGVVSFVGRNGGYGRVVEIDHGHGFVTRYAHLQKTYVKKGQEVSKGDKIAGMGSTGRSTGSHLHYEVHFQGRVYDPNSFLRAGLYVQ